MANPAPSDGKHAGGAVHRLGVSARHWSADIGRRAYAAALILVIFWVSYRAVRYLVVSLIVPTSTPAQISGIPKRLDASVLAGERPDWLGLSSVDNPRGPLSHFHRFEVWLPNDRVNDCTRSGCHAPLPHSKRKEVRAFLNMHATTLHCGVCHMKTNVTPLPLLWYRIADGKASPPPALLRAYGWLARRAATTQPATKPEQAEIVGMLSTAIAEAHVEPSLQRITRDLNAVRAGSTEFQRLLGDARDAVERGMRGAYGAKMALRDGGTTPILGQPDTASAVKSYLREKDGASPERRDELLRAVHPLRRDEALQCTSCHRENGSLIDFAAMGYPAERIQNLFRPSVFKMVENIALGTPFHLPELSEEGHKGPTTQPRP
ncbi:MAG: hypothetical protein U1D55_19275 [Phycisphaerae bacterium]